MAVAAVARGGSIIGYRSQASLAGRAGDFQWLAPAVLPAEPLGQARNTRPHNLKVPFMQENEQHTSRYLQYYGLN